MYFADSCVFQDSWMQKNLRCEQVEFYLLFGLAATGNDLVGRAGYIVIEVKFATLRKDKDSEVYS